MEDYIKSSSNLDNNIFEKIGALLIHGLENEELLTSEYIRILKQLTWINLQIFLELRNAGTEETIVFLVKKLNYPIELV